MFGKLKDKLKGWFKSSKKKITESEDSTKIDDSEALDSEKAPIVKTKEEKTTKSKDSAKKQSSDSKKSELASKKTEKKKKTIKPKKELSEEKADELIEKAKEQEIPKTPVKFDVAREKFEPDIEEIKEQIKEEKKSEEKKEKEKIKEESNQQDEEEIIKPKEPEQKKSFFSKIKSSISYKITEDAFDEIFDDLEMLLLENNVALEAVEDLRKKLSEKLVGQEIPKKELEQEIKKELKNALNEILIEPDNPLEMIREKEKPFIILFFGINGTGKTTSIAKIANFLKKAGFSVVLAAGDTFRAASIEQLSEHASNLKIPIIKHDYQSDPAAVGFDAIKHAKTHSIDVVLIDTAGRMHTKLNLLSEMEKIARVCKPDLKIFVAESIAGNDATEQAKAFHKSIHIDGTILSKADIDEKGGTIISISHATNKPIFYLGTGQNYDDLELFNKQKFIESLGL